MNVNATEVLQDLVYVHIDIHVYHGRSKLRIEDLKDVDASQIPPGMLASLGSKRICDKQEIDKFLANKRATERMVDAATVRLMGGRATSAKAAEKLIEKIADKQDEFRSLRDSFLRRFDDIFDSWKQANPQWAHMFPAQGPSKQRVERQLRFEYQAAKLSDIVPTAKIETGLLKAVSGLGAQLFREVAVSANQAYEKSYLGRAEVNRKALRPIQSIYEKLGTLSFVDPRVSPVRARVKETLDTVPKTGPIAGNVLTALTGLLLLLSDPDKTMTFGATAIQLPNEIPIEPTPIVADQQTLFVPAAASDTSVGIGFF